MKNKDLVLSNTAIQLLGRIISSSLTFFATYLIISIAGAPLYGDLSKITALLAIGYTALDFGINAHIIRIFSSNKENIKATFSNLLLLRTLLSLFIILLTSIFIYSLPGGNNHGYTPSIKYAYLIGSITIIFHGVCLTANSYFQYKLAYHKSVISSSIGAIIMFISTIFYLNGSGSLQGLTLAIIFGYFINASLSLYFVRSLITLKVNLRSATKILKDSASLGILLILSILANKSDTIVLGLFRSSSEVGQYNFAYKIFDFALVLPIFVMNAVYPTLLDQTLTFKDKSKIIKSALKTLLIISISGSVALFLFSPLVLYIRPELTLVPPVLKLLSLSLPLFYTTAPLMWLIVSEKKEKLIIPIYLIAGFVNIFGNYIFSSLYGVYSASLLTFATEFVILTGLYYANKKSQLL